MSKSHAGGGRVPQYAACRYAVVTSDDTMKMQRPCATHVALHVSAISPCIVPCSRRGRNAACYISRRGARGRPRPFLVGPRAPRYRLRSNHRKAYLYEQAHGAEYFARLQAAVIQRDLRLLRMFGEDPDQAEESLREARLLLQQECRSRFDISRNASLRFPEQDESCAPPLALPVYTLVQDTLQKCSKPPATPHVVAPSVGEGPRRRCRETCHKITSLYMPAVLAT